MSNPIKHHYIPEFILSRFCDTQNKIHSFNKVTWKINRKKFSPAGVCYEPHLHTLIYEDERSYEIEKFYSQIEDEFSNFLKIIDSHFENGLELNEFPRTEEISNLVAVLLNISFWRIPKRRNVAKEARKNLRKIFDSAPIANRELLGFDRGFIRDLERKKEGVSTKISQFLVLPALLSNARNSAVQECWFYSTKFDLIISDDPIVCDLKEDYSLDGDIYLPIGSRLCITNSPEKIDFFQKKIFDNARNIVMANTDSCFASFVSTD